MKTSSRRIYTMSLAASLTVAFMLSAMNGCGPKESETNPKANAATKPYTTTVATQPKSDTPEEPCTTQGAPEPKVMPADPGSLTPKKPRRMWATSYRWAKAPDFVVEKWLTDKPETKGKYVLIEFWATWCPPCRRSIPLLNKFHKKYGKELVVIGISEESEADVRKLKTPNIEYYSAFDTRQRMYKELGVFGIPHVIIVEPGGFVIWEGFPLLPDYELTEEIIEKILAVGRKLKAAEAANSK